MSERTAITDNAPTLGDLRVWHIPQIPGQPFVVPVSSFADGERVMDILAAYDLFQYENRIKPDYANASGIERYEDDPDDGFGWFDVDPEWDEDWSANGSQAPDDNPHESDGTTPEACAYCGDVWPCAGADHA